MRRVMFGGPGGARSCGCAVRCGVFHLVARKIMRPNYFARHCWSGLLVPPIIGAPSILPIGIVVIMYVRWSPHRIESAHVYAVLIDAAWAGLIIRV